jgi:hypothetical protein
MENIKRKNGPLFACQFKFVNQKLVRQLIDKVTVFEGRFTVEFKYSVTVDVER